MKIAHVITRMIIGGAQENTLWNCLDLIDLYGDEVLLICGPSSGPEGNLLRESGLVTTAVERGRAMHRVAGRLPVCEINSLRRNIHPQHDLRASRQLRRILGEFQPDVVHTHSAKGGLLGRRTAWAAKVPAIVHTVHGAPFHAYQSAVARRLFIACERWAAKRCHHLISVADAMTDLMIEAGVGHRDQFTTIPSGMDVEPFLSAEDHRDRVRAQFGFEDHHVVIGKIARLFQLKGHDDVIDAAAEVINANPNVRFLWVGDGILREALQAKIDRKGFHDHFVFSGLVPPSEVPRLIGGMDMLVHASYREGLARALPQTLIAGRPVISYDIDGAREVTITDQTGVLVPPGDVRGLSDAMKRLSLDAALRRRLGQAGRDCFVDRFRHQTMTREIRELYRAILRR